MSFKKEQFEFFKTQNDFVGCFLPEVVPTEQTSTVLSLLNPKSELIELQVAVNSADKEYQRGSFVYVRPSAMQHAFMTEAFDVAEHKIILVPKSEIVLSVSEWFANK